MAYIFETITPIGDTGLGATASISSDGKSIVVDYSPITDDVKYFIDGIYQATITGGTSSTKTISITDPYRLSSGTLESFQSGTYTVAFQLGSSSSNNFDGTTSDYTRWEVQIGQEVLDSTTPTYTSPEINVTFYSGNEDGIERIKLDGFDPTLIDSVDVEYTLSDSTVVPGSFTSLDSSPFCIELTTSTDASISTFNFVKVNFSDGTMSEIITNLDYAGDTDIQSNVWPGQCIEGDGTVEETPNEAPHPTLCLDVNEGDPPPSVEESLYCIRKAIESIATILSEPITVRPEPSKEWAFNRAATVNALREAQQLENVFNEMTEPTRIPDAGYKSEKELSEQSEGFFRPTEQRFDPSYENQGCPFDPIPPEELVPPVEPPTDENGGEESCHPPY